eukprot:SAG31_NODE_35449_length_323_cov_0.687500_1_plen_51_part_01
MYAHQVKVPMVPLMLADCKPRGWLGPTGYGQLRVDHIVGHADQKCLTQRLF